MGDADEEPVEELPPSSKLVYKTLEYEGPLTQQDIAEVSLLSNRTVRYALERLETNDIVDKEFYFADARQDLYRLTDGQG